MSLSGREIYTKNKDMQRYLDILCKEQYVEMPSRLAQEFGRNRAVQRYRLVNSDIPRITIAKDHKFNISAVKIKEPLFFKKEGKTYRFELHL